MKSKPKICRNCKYCDKNPLKIWCEYWRSKVAPLAACQACSKYEEKEDEDYWENVTGL